jgi:hypothetical protein
MGTRSNRNLLLKIKEFDSGYLKFFFLNYLWFGLGTSADPSNGSPIAPTPAWSRALSSGRAPSK